MSHSGQLANVLSWIIPGISWRLGNHPWWHVSSLRNRPQSASVASVSPVHASDGTWTGRMRLTPSKPLIPPESEQVSPCKGSCTTGEVPQRGSRVRRCPFPPTRFARWIEYARLTAHTQFIVGLELVPDAPQTMSAGHGLTLPPSFVESQPCLLPSLVRCPSAFLEGVCDNSQTQLHSITRHWVPELEQGANLFWSIFVLSSMPFSPHGVSWVFYGVFFLAKVGQTGATPRTASYSETNFAAAFHRCNLGIPQNFFLNFLA